MKRFFLMMFFVCSIGNGQELKLTTPDEAVRLALQDVQEIEETERTSTRWIWIQDGDLKTAQFVAQAANLSLRHTSQPQRPIVVGGGYMLRIEGRRFAPNPKDLERILNVWENGFGFNFDNPEPYFHEFFDKADENAFVVQQEVEIVVGNKLIAKVPSGSTLIKTGKMSEKGDWTEVTFGDKQGFIQTKFVVVQELESIQVVKFATHLDPSIETLKELTGSTVPIVEARFFCRVALSSVDGGQYYKFRGIEGSTIKDGKVVKSALEKFVERAGADFKQLNRKSNRLAMISEQTGTWRRVDVWHGDLRRPKDGPPFVWLTFDQRNKRRRGTEHSLRSLVSLKYDAIEAIILTDHGTEFALFAGNNINDGKLKEIDIHQLADSAPDDVTRDHKIPAPHTARLQSCISCIRCHGSSRGFMKLENEVLPYLKNRDAVNIVLDTDSGRNIHETLDLVAGLYDWNPDVGEAAIASVDDPLEVSRRSLDREVFLATSGLDTEDAFKGISNLYGEYSFTRVTPEMVCRELGVLATAEDAPNKLIELLGVKMGFESPIVNRLQLGRPILRSDLEAELPAMFFRAKTNRGQAKIEKGLKNGKAEKIDPGDGDDDSSDDKLARE